MTVTFMGGAPSAGAPRPSVIRATTRAPWGSPPTRPPALWAVAESLLRDTVPGFSTSLDAFVARRLGPRGGVAILSGLGAIQLAQEPDGILSLAGQQKLRKKREKARQARIAEAEAASHGGEVPQHERTHTDDVVVDAPDHLARLSEQEARDREPNAGSPR